MGDGFSRTGRRWTRLDLAAAAVGGWRGERVRAPLAAGAALRRLPRPASGRLTLPAATGLHRKIHDPRSQHGSRGKSRHQFPIQVHAPSSALISLNARGVIYVSEPEPLK